MQKTNPLDKNGEISKCNVCGSIYHWTKQYPDSYENKTKPKGESQITLLEECMDTLIGETLSMAVIDSGCTKTVWPGMAWLLLTIFKQWRPANREEKS